MNVSSIVIYWLLLSTLALFLVMPFLRIAKQADERAEDLWGNERE
ncbi:hypothetical protein [Cohnella sp.]